MQNLKPTIDNIKRLYGDDKKKVQRETSELYKKAQISPLAGRLLLLHTLNHHLLHTLFAHTLLTWQAQGTQTHLRHSLTPLPTLLGLYCADLRKVTLLSWYVSRVSWCFSALGLAKQADLQARRPCSPAYSPPPSCCICYLPMQHPCMHWKCGAVRVSQLRVGVYVTRAEPTYR